MKVKSIHTSEIMECLKTIFIVFVCLQNLLIHFFKIIVCKWFSKECKYVFKEKENINKYINNNLEISFDDCNEETSNEGTSYEEDNVIKLTTVRLEWKFNYFEKRRQLIRWPLLRWLNIDNMVMKDIKKT